MQQEHWWEWCGRKRGWICQWVGLDSSGIIFWKEVQMEVCFYVKCAGNWHFSTRSLWYKRWGELDWFELYLLNGHSVTEVKKIPIYLTRRTLLQETLRANVKGSPLKSSWNPMIWTLPLCQRRRSGLPQRRYFSFQCFWKSDRKWAQTPEPAEWEAQCNGLWFLLAGAQEWGSTLPKGAGCCVMMKKSAKYRGVPHPSPLVMRTGEFWL